MTQYTHIYFDAFGLSELLGLQSNIVMLKNVDTKVAGRKSVVSRAIAFMAVLSRFDSTAIEAENLAWARVAVFMIFEGG